MEYIVLFAFALAFVLAFAFDVCTAQPLYVTMAMVSSNQREVERRVVVLHEQATSD